MTVWAARGLEYLGGVADAVVEHLPAVVAEGVAHLRGGDAVAVGELRVEGHLVVLFRQVLTDNGDVERMSKVLRKLRMVVRAPGQPPRAVAVVGGGEGTEAPVDLEGVSAHEAAGEVGLVELLGYEVCAQRPHVAVDAFVERAEEDGVRVEHQVLADEAGRVGDAVGELGRAGVEHQARSADSVAGENHSVRLLLLDVAVGVVVEHAVGESFAVYGDLPDAAVGLDLRAEGQRLGPVCDVGGSLGAASAADVARSAVVAGGPSVVWSGQDGGV